MVANVTDLPIGRQAVKPFWSPLMAGVALGLVLLLTFVWTGHGLGATGASTRLTAWLGNEVAPIATQANEYLGGMVEGGANPLPSWISWQVIGVAIGALVAAFLGGRFRVQLDGARTVGTPKRLATALIGGLGLSGAATLGIAAFVFLATFFASGLIVSRLVKGV
jgi:uncharacterized protein